MTCLDKFPNNVLHCKKIFLTNLKWSCLWDTLKVSRGGSNFFARVAIFASQFVSHSQSQKILPPLWCVPVFNHFKPLLGKVLSRGVLVEALWQFGCISLSIHHEISHLVVTFCFKRKFALDFPFFCCLSPRTSSHENQFRFFSFAQMWSLFLEYHRRVCRICSSALKICLPFFSKTCKLGK